MQLVVQKFGGTSVKNKQTRKHVINHIQQELINGYKLIVIVSAMGRIPDPYATDTLLSLVDYPKTFNSKREIDLLIAAGEIISSVVLSNELQQKQIKAIALTGAQAGIITDHNFNDATISEINPDRINKELKQYDVIVVAGFQGQTNNGDITTLGRGGSDTTAITLGVSLEAERIEIFTDVNGVMTADPRIVKNAKQLHAITYTEICNLAHQGANVIHPRAVEIAMQSKVPLRVRCTHSTENKGTLITDGNQLTGTSFRERAITGIAHRSELAQIKVEINNKVSIADIFKVMAEANISVDFINISLREVIFTIPMNVIDTVLSTLKKLGLSPIINKDCVKISIIGAGMAGLPGIVSKIANTLTRIDVKILQAADSHTTIWILIKDKDTDKALNSLHNTFKLSEVG